MPAEAEAASDAARSSEFQTDRVATISFGHALHDTYSAFLSPLLPVFIENLSLTNAQAGLLTVFQQAPSLLQPFIGHLADRLSLRYFVILAPAVTATTMSLLGIAPSYVILIFLLLITGLSSSTLHAVAPVMAGRLSGKSLGKGMGFWMVGGEFGRTVGPIVIVTTIELGGLEATPWLMVGGWLASLVLFFRLRDVPGKPSGEATGLPWRQALSTMGPFLPWLVGIVTLRGFLSASMTTYLPVLLTDEGTTLWLAGVSLALLEAAGVVGALVGGSISDRLGRRRVLYASLMVTPFLMLAFLAVGGWARMPLLLLMGFTALSITPVIMALVQESFPENPALANGMYMSLSFLIRSGAVVVVGLMGDGWGLRTAFAVTAVMPLVGVPVLLMMRRK
jgi:FSR family fosmidomycin resistance protein-like MFS transporter